MPLQPCTLPTGTPLCTRTASAGEAVWTSSVSAASAPRRRRERRRSGPVPAKTHVSPSFVGIIPAAAPSPYAHS